MRALRLLACTAALLLSAEAHAGTLFDDLGGRAGLERIVASATVIWTADPRIAATFEETNLDRFKRLLVDHLCQIAGGGCAYRGRPMHEVHKGLHLDTRQFNALAEDLQRAMDQFEVPFSVQNRLLALLAPMYRDVVTR